MERLNLNSNILKISLNKYDDTLELDSADMNIYKKFSCLIERFDSIADEAGKRIAVLNQKHKDSDYYNLDAIMEYVDVNIEYSKMLLNELDEVFGNGFCKKVYRESYELNPDFVPDEYAIVELIEALVPIIEKAYGERIKRTKSKYNAGKRGKHSKTKEQLIEEYKEKNGMNE